MPLLYKGILSDGDGDAEGVAAVGSAQDGKCARGANPQNFSKEV